MYTIDDVKNKVKELGWDYNTALSDADRKLAEQNPDAGMSIVNYKLDWQNAETDDQRLRANEGANRIREQYGSYTANDSGEGFYSVPSAPTYKGTYDDQYDALLQQYVNTPSFSYNAEQDPLYSSYKKTYAREGQRATQDTMASAAAMTGGLPSSYAVGAAQQAGNVYSAAMADKVPELYKLAYDKYLNELDIAASKVSMVGNAMNTEYNRYIDSRDQYNTDRDYYATQAQRAIQNDHWERQFQNDQEQQDIDNYIAEEKNDTPTTGQNTLYKDIMFGSGISGNGGVTNLTSFDSLADAVQYIKEHSSELEMWLGKTLYNKMLDEVEKYYSNKNSKEKNESIGYSAEELSMLNKLLYGTSAGTVGAGKVGKGLTGYGTLTEALDQISKNEDWYRNTLGNDLYQQMIDTLIDHYSNASGKTETDSVDYFDQAFNDYMASGEEFSTWYGKNLTNYPLSVLNQLAEVYDNNRLPVSTGLPSQEETKVNTVDIPGEAIPLSSEASPGIEGTMEYWENLANEYAKEAEAAYKKGDMKGYQEAARKLAEAKKKYESLKEKNEYGNMTEDEFDSFIKNL